MDERSPDCLVIRGGLVLRSSAHEAAALDILVQGGRITELGQPGMPAPAQAREIDARGRLLHAGLVNAHTHGHGAYAKAMGDRWTLELLLNAGPWINGSRTQEDLYLSAVLNAAEMVLKGCTACYDLYSQAPAPTAEGMRTVAKAYGDVGMRALIAPMVADRSLYDTVPGLVEALPEDLRAYAGSLRPQSYDATLAALRDFLAEGRVGPLVRAALAPTIPQLCSDEFLRACRDCAADLDLRLHSHIAESRLQAVAGCERHGGTIVAHLDRLGLLSERLTMAHAVWLTEDDMIRAAARGASVAHNPASNMRLGSGIADVRGMLEHGVTVGLGADGSNSSDNQNMYEAMRLASFSSKVRTPRFETWLTTREAFHAATEGGARCLGMDGELGRLEVGYQADIVFLDLDHINWIPLNDPVNQLVHTEDATAVDSVLVGGRFVVRGRQLVNVDLPGVAKKVALARARLAELTEDKRLMAERLGRIVGPFCADFACCRPYPVDRYGYRDGSCA